MNFNVHQIQNNLVEKLPRGAFFVKTAKIFENFQIHENLKFSSNFRKYNL
jgi:hypothetical protein